MNLFDKGRWICYFNLAVSYMHLNSNNELMMLNLSLGIFVALIITFVGEENEIEG